MVGLPGPGDEEGGDGEDRCDADEGAACAGGPESFGAARAREGTALGLERAGAAGDASSCNPDEGRSSMQSCFDT